MGGNDLSWGEGGDGELSGGDSLEGTQGADRISGGDGNDLDHGAGFGGLESRGVVVDPTCCPCPRVGGGPPIGRGPREEVGWAGRG